MTKQNNGWYSICYNTWMFDKDIRSELALLLYITGFTANTWECFASNQHFAEKFDESLVTISRKVNKLIKKGYVEASYEKLWTKVTKRTITVNKFDKCLSEMITDGYQKWCETVIKNDTYTNTSITKTSITKEDKIKKQTTAQQIFDYYKAKFWVNKKAHKRAVALDRIVARLELTSEPLIIKAIDSYFSEKDITEPVYIKPCENFFWNVPWTKHKFIEGFLDDIKDEEDLKLIPLQDLSESQMRIRIWYSLEEIRTFKTSINDEFAQLNSEEKIRVKELFKKIENDVMRELGLYQ